MVSIAPTPLYLPDEEAIKIFKSPIPPRRNVSSSTCSPKDGSGATQSPSQQQSSLYQIKKSTSLSSAIETKQQTITTTSVVIPYLKETQSTNIDIYAKPVFKLPTTTTTTKNHLINKQNNNINKPTKHYSSQTTKSTLNNIVLNHNFLNQRRIYDLNQIRLIKQSSIGLTKYQPKISVGNGLGGNVYFVKGLDNENVSVFKPMDEENGIVVSSSSTLSGLKHGTIVGEGPYKEVATYLFDQRHNGFFKVPVTTLVEISHPFWNKSTPNNNNNNSTSNEIQQSNNNNQTKIGSLQQFISYDDTAEEIGCSKFTVDDVHRIGLLDCIIYNCDRHSGNILVVNSDDGAEQPELIPIDHSLCLPSSDSLSDGWFDWINFPQSKVPFDEKTKEFINSINIDMDIQYISRVIPELRQECLETLKITTTFLKKCIQNNLTLQQIGRLMTRFYDLEKPSSLEIILDNVYRKSNVKGSSFSLLFNQSFWIDYQREIDTFLINNNQ